MAGGGVPTTNRLEALPDDVRGHIQSWVTPYNDHRAVVDELKTAVEHRFAGTGVHEVFFRHASRYTRADYLWDPPCNDWTTGELVVMRVELDGRGRELPGQKAKFWFLD